MDLSGLRSRWRYLWTLPVAGLMNEFAWEFVLRTGLVKSESARLIWDERKW